MAEDRENLTTQQRLISGAEMGLAIFLVVAHNVYHWIPNEVPILVVLAIVSIRVREGNWGTVLYRSPKSPSKSPSNSWIGTFVAAAGCMGLLLVKDLILEPVGHHFWPEEHVSSVISQAHDIRHALLSFLLVWTFAAFGEEIGYRGYLLRRAIEAFGPSRWGIGLALVVGAVAFGFGHYYKGPAGILDSTGSGLILGAAYIASRRLWVSTLAHGLNDTLAVMFTFFGW